MTAAGLPIVTIFGSSLPVPGDEAYQQAYELGQSVTRIGWTVCNGGYGGTMAATAEGAVAAGGRPVGVTCAPISALPGRGGPNPFIAEEIPTQNLFQRIKTLMTLGQAYVVLPGGTGTLLELAAVWEFMNKGFDGFDRPIVTLGTTWSAVVRCVSSEAPMRSQPSVCQEVSEVVAILQKL
jgi:uncharacterized protein (TIGR00730 family)